MKLFYLLILFLLPAVLALDIQVYSIIFDIKPDMRVREEIKIVFSQPIEERNLTYTITGDVENVKANNTIEEVTAIREGEKIILLIPNGSRQVYLSFETSGLVKPYKDGEEFLTYLYLPASKANRIAVLLPKGYALYKDGVIPKGELITDGERIGIVWQNKRDTALIIRFYQPQKNKLDLAIAIASFTAALIVYLKYRKDESYLLGFSADEARVIEEVKKRKVCYQNKLEKDLGFSRAKMTRIVKKLEEKGLIEKERIGRTNKIRWKQKTVSRMFQEVFNTKKQTIF
jgi:hypothetical protein